MALAVVLSILAMGVGAQAENKLTTAWEKGLSKGEVSVLKEADGTEYTSATGIGNPWESPTIDVLGAIKAALGEDGVKDGGEVYIAFDARIKVAEDSDPDTIVIGRSLLRMATEHAATELKAIFDENYEGTLFTCDDNGNAMAYIAGQGTNVELSSEWSHYDINFSVDSTDLTWAGDKWNFCLDMLGDVADIAALEFKNVGVYDYTYEPVEPDEPDVPDVPDVPGDGEEPGGENVATPTVVPQTPFNNKPTAAPTATAGAEENEGGNNNMTTIIIVAVVAAVVIAAVVVGVVMAKKKKANDAPDAEDDNKKEE